MANNPAKRYDKDLGKAIPIVRFGPSERPRLNTTPAPYLPLKLHNERHDEYYVMLTGKVMALDSFGFAVPAGLALQREAAVAAGDGAAWPASCERYDATDVANGVINAQGDAAQDGEPVVHAMLSTAAYDSGDDTVDLNNAPATAITVGNHIGVVPQSLLRAGSDVMSRAASDTQPAATGSAALVPYDPTQLRNLAWELQNRTTALVADECLLLPVVADRSALLLEGQTVAIGAMADFGLGDYVTYNENSDLVPATASASAFSNIVPDMSGADGADATAVSAAILSHSARIVGQVVRKNERFPSSYLDKVKTRWESSIPGFNDIDRMPGSATGGYPWHMHTAQSTLGEVQVSLLMR